MPNVCSVLAPPGACSQATIGQQQQQQYEANMEFPEEWGGGIQTQTPSTVGYGYVLEHTLNGLLLSAMLNPPTKIIMIRSH